MRMTSQTITIEQKRALADRIYKLEEKIKTLVYLLENHRKGWYKNV